MLLLKINDRPIEVGNDDEIMAEFEERVVRFNTETSGWDAEGNFLTLREMPDVTDYEEDR